MAKLFIAAPFIGRNVALAYERVEDIKRLHSSSEAYVVEDPTGQFAVVIGTAEDVRISREIMQWKIFLARTGN